MQEIKEDNEKCQVDEEHRSTINKKNGKVLHKIRQQMEFYFSDSNLEKDRFLGKLVKKDENGYVDLEVFKTFNKIRVLTDDVQVIAKGVSHSTFIELSEDSKRVHRKVPFLATEKNKIDDRTIYVERLPSHSDYKFVKNIFNRFGHVAYVAIPRFKASKKIKGFAFVEFESEESVKKACEYYSAKEEQEKEESDNDETPSKKPQGKRKSFDSQHTKGKDHSFQKDSRRRKKSGSEKASRKSCECPENKGGSTKESKAHKHERGHHCRKRKRQSSESEGLPKRQRLHTVSSSSDTEAKVAIKDEVINSSCEDMLNESTENSRSEHDAKISCSHRKRNRSRERTEVNKVRTKTVEDSVANESKEKGPQRYEGTEEQEMKDIEDQKEEIFSTKVIETKKEDMEIESKNKRKRKKSNNKLKLRVMTKAEWKSYRNKYLTLQRKALSCIKKMLLIDKQQRTECESMLSCSTSEDTTNKSCSQENASSDGSITYQAGVIVKVTLPEATTTAFDLRKKVKSCVEVAFVDISDGCSEMFLRFHQPDIASAALENGELSQFGLCEAISGEAEKAYWEKLHLARQEHLNRPREKRRGREKILAKAAKLSEQKNIHVHFDE